MSEKRDATFIRACNPAVYAIPETPGYQLFPLLEIAGLLILGAAIFAGRKSLLAAGIIVLACGAIPERDIAVFVGGILFAIAVYLYIK
ncbi:MAG: hypothetical protein K2H64_04970 [Desulfovibrio sp.]|nr:hypothetical protein [Desulfovibrio sp.]